MHNSNYRRRRPIIGVLVAMIMIMVVGTGAVVIGNDYRISERRLSIPVTGGVLEAVLALPDDAAARGLVLMVHGDGPVEATHDGLYRPWFEAAAEAGFATLSWSKPGIGASSGDWLGQSMDDRAAEVSAVVDWAHGQADLPTDTLVLWGVSQAGWVLPKITAARDDIDAVVAVSPAVNWLRQGRYNLLAELDHSNADPAERERAIAVSDQTRALLEQDASHDTYLAATADPEPMDPGRWTFVKRNYTADATAELKAGAAKGIPVLLMLGDHDRHVDVTETSTTYQDLLDDDVTIDHFDAAHSMAKPAVEDSELLGLATGLFWPRALLADRVLDSYRDHLRDRWR